MKLYKFDYKGTIGNNVITVPTDSQFLIGIGNGDASSTAQLFDAATEILPEDTKIGDYTCFRMETQGTQFRKPYKAVINGNNFEDKSLWVIWFDDVDYKGYVTIGLFIPDNVNVEDLNYDDGKTPVLTSFKSYVYGWTREGGNTYLETITLTWNADKTAYEIPIDMGGEMWAKYIQFSECDNENRLNGEYGQTSYNDGGNFDLDADDGKETVPSPIPYTQNIDLYIICKKMSVAYRDETGITASEAVDAVKDSGKFLEKTKIGQSDFFKADAAIFLDDNMGVSLNGGELTLGTTEEIGAACLILAPNDNTEEVDAEGTINGGSELIIKNATLDKPIFVDGILDGDENYFEPLPITINGTSYYLWGRRA